MPIRQQDAFGRIAHRGLPPAGNRCPPSRIGLRTRARLVRYPPAGTSQTYLVGTRKLRGRQQDADQIETIPFLMAK